MKLETFISKVGDRKVVSFDVFDTLIERDCLLPSDIFVRVGEAVIGEGKGKEFREKRIAAERIARSKSSSGEVTLTDIYDCLPPYAEASKESLIKAEMDAEMSACRPKERNIPLYEWATKNKTVILTTDMYLSTDFIRQMLTKCGIAAPANIFNSCECGVDKVSGSLFSFAAESLGIATTDIAHVGDNLHADIKGAKKAGATPIFIPCRNFLRRMLTQRLQSLARRLKLGGR